MGIYYSETQNSCYLFQKNPNLSKKFTKNVDEITAKMRRPGVEPGTSAWKAPMLTVTPSTLVFMGNMLGL